MPFFLKIVGCFLLLYQLRHIFNHPRVSVIEKCSFRANEWILYDKKGQKFVFERHKVILEAGIFFLLEFSNSQQRKVIVVFFDQLTVDQYQSLKLIEKVRE